VTASDEQLEWEARAGKPAAAFAFLAVFLLLAATVVRQSAFPNGGDNDREILQSIHDHSSAYVQSAVLQGLSTLALIGVLLYLCRLIKARNPDFQPWIMPLVIGGPILLCAAGILTSLHEVDIANTFVNSGAETAKRADELRKDTQPLAVGLSFGGTFAVAISFVLVTMNAMRVGLLTRFTGIVGVIIGVLFVVPILPGFILQVFWLAAVGVLFLGYWPGGRGPAWETGQAIPWPSGVQRAAAGEAAASIPPEPELEAGDSAAEPRSKNPRKSKKRKRRR
jgi:hypothetical protein